MKPKAWLVFFKNADGGHSRVYINSDLPIKEALKFTTEFVRQNFINAQRVDALP